MTITGFKFFRQTAIRGVLSGGLAFVGLSFLTDVPQLNRTIVFAAFSALGIGIGLAGWALLWRQKTQDGSHGQDSADTVNEISRSD